MANVWKIQQLPEGDGGGHPPKRQTFAEVWGSALLGALNLTPEPMAVPKTYLRASDLMPGDRVQNLVTHEIGVVKKIEMASKGYLVVHFRGMVPHWFRPNGSNDEEFWELIEGKP